MTRLSASKSPRRKPGPSHKLNVENLKTNNITICGNLPANKTHWPACVKQLEYHLLHSFAGLISHTDLKNKKDLWGRGLPRDAVDSESVRFVLRKKEERVESARKVKNECQGFFEQGKDVVENVWSDTWNKIFQDHVATPTSSHGNVTLVRDMRFVKMISAHLYDVEECRLTQPQPDITLAFGSGHGHATLVDLWQRYGLLSSPLKDGVKVCFPWAIFEAKSTASRGKPRADWQAVNAATKCLRILENLEKVPGSPRSLQMGVGETLPIPCFTCQGPKWELWICYRSEEDEFQKPIYQLDKVFDGDMGDLWSCVQLLRIVERLKEWALDTFKPRIDRYLKAWVKYAKINPPLVRFGERPEPNRCTNIPNERLVLRVRSLGKLSLLSQDANFSLDNFGDGEYSDCDSGIAGDYEDEKAREREVYSVDRKYPLSRPPLPDHRDTGFLKSDAAETEFDDSGIFVSEDDEDDENPENPEDDEDDEDEDDESEDVEGNEDDGEEIQRSGLLLRRSSRIGKNPKYDKSFSYRV